MLPNKLIQCIAVGRHVLTPETPALRSAFEEQEVAGCRPADPVSLNGTVHRLIADGGRREAIARAGRSRYLRDYSRQALTRVIVRHVAELRNESERS